MVSMTGDGKQCLSYHLLGVSVCWSRGLCPTFWDKGQYVCAEECPHKRHITTTSQANILLVQNIAGTIHTLRVSELSTEAYTRDTVMQCPRKTWPHNARLPSCPDANAHSHRYTHTTHPHPQVFIHSWDATGKSQCAISRTTPTRVCSTTRTQIILWLISQDQWVHKLQ